ncbi:response regulator [Pseudorhodoferax sp. LjRoot39]|uniref:response regulator n=1 Tax=Pseudorhodoferax sp. LjRoot39 TaxID=3342328 RepID=UPI003ECD8605
MSPTRPPEATRTAGEAEGPPLHLPRVLLVEDDPAMRRFVDAVLEDQGVELRSTGCIVDAIAELAAAPCALVLTDLMLAGESGRSLVQRLRDEPALGSGPRVAVMSAGLNAEISADLLALGAWRLLHKPVSVEQLRQCVRDALDAGPACRAATAQAAPPSAIDTYFGGNARIYRLYREACEQQFPYDVVEGDRALAARDAAAMRRLGHTLKSVLQALGQDLALDAARAIDLASAQNDWAVVAQQWPVLRTALQGLIARSNG